jgi:hypothetical protein
MSNIKLNSKRTTVAKETPSCSKYRRLWEVFVGETAETLAAKIANLEHKDFHVLFKKLIDAIKTNGNNDFNEGWHQLGTLLLGLAKSLEHSSSISKEISMVYKSYMTKKKKKVKKI